MRLLVAALAATLALTACSGNGQAETPRILPDGDRANLGVGPVAALALWQDFPVTADPRPLIVLNPFEFMTELDASAQENGFGRGLWTFPASMSADPPRRKGHRILSARDAAERLLQAVAADVNEDFDAIRIKPEPIAVTSARLVDRRYSTDRGSVVLPAWEFRFGAEHTEPTVALATADELYDPNFESAAGGLAVLAADGRTLSLRFTRRRTSDQSSAIAHAWSDATEVSGRRLGRGR